MILQHTATLIAICIVGLAMLTNTTIADEPELTTSTSTDSVRVAEPFTLAITVKADQGTKVTFPEGQSKLGPFDVRESKDMFDIPTTSDSNSRTWTRIWTLDTIETGDLQVPQINVQVQPLSGDGSSARERVVQQLTSNSIPVRVASVLEDRSDPTKFRDIESVVDVAVPETSTSYIPWAVGGAGLTAFALFAAIAVVRRLQSRTPLNWAMEQLDSLDPTVEDITIQLSQIIREFLLIQFEILESGSTPQEIVDRLQSDKKLGATTVKRLNLLFGIADEAKFAGLRLSPEGLASVINDSRVLVTQIAGEITTAGR